MFAKIHDNEKYGQILVQKGFDPDQDQNFVSLSIEFRDCIVKTSIGGMDTDNMDEMFETMDNSRAQLVLEELLPKF